MLITHCPSRRCIRCIRELGTDVVNGLVTSVLLHGQASLTPDSSVYLSQSIALSALRHLSGALCALSQLPQLICKPIFMEDVICILQEF